MSELSDSMELVSNSIEAKVQCYTCTANDIFVLAGRVLTAAAAAWLWRGFTPGMQSAVRSQIRGGDREGTAQTGSMQSRCRYTSLDTTCSHITVDKTLHITVDTRPAAVQTGADGCWLCPGQIVMRRLEAARGRDTGPSAGLKGAGLAPSRGASDPRPLLCRGHRVAWCGVWVLERGEMIACMVTCCFFLKIPR